MKDLGLIYSSPGQLIRDDSRDIWLLGPAPRPAVYSRMKESNRNSDRVRQGLRNLVSQKQTQRRFVIGPAIDELRIGDFASLQ